MEIAGIGTTRSAFRDDVTHGLSRDQKSLPCKYFYDAAGCFLFDQICELEEYYPTRVEIGIMRERGHEMAMAVGPNARIVELGSGSGLKTSLLLERLWCPAAYVPIDIAPEYIASSTLALRSQFPGIEILPVCADYHDDFAIPDGRQAPDRTVLYFPGSTIGNFHPSEALAFLTRAATMAGPGGGLLIGVDLKKDIARLERAYNDSLGVTATFNLNLLVRANRELGANFDLDGFEHHAFYNEWRGRIEMHLASTQRQDVTIGGERFLFEEDETIHTECSYKYGLAEFAVLAYHSGFRVDHVWTDPELLFSVQFLSVA